MNSGPISSPANSQLHLIVSSQFHPTYTPLMATPLRTSTLHIPIPACHYAIGNNDCLENLNRISNVYRILIVCLHLQSINHVLFLVIFLSLYVTITYYTRLHSFILR